MSIRATYVTNVAFNIILPCLLIQLHSGRPVKQSGTRQYDEIMSDFNRDWLEDFTRTVMTQFLPSYQQRVVDSTVEYTMQTKPTPVFQVNINLIISFLY